MPPPTASTRWCSTRETVPFVDVTAAAMLVQLRGELERDGVRLAVARDIGQVRDVLREAEGTTSPLFATVEEAVRRVR